MMYKKMLMFFLFLTILSCKSTSESETDKFVNYNIVGRTTFENKTLALTIDDGPTVYTWRILDSLEELNKKYAHKVDKDDCAVKAIFFVTGRLVSSAAERKFRDRITNHPKKCYILGNHTEDHTVKNLSKQIREGHESIKNIMVPGSVRFFRAPGGARINASVANNATAEDYVGPMFWDIGGDHQNLHADPKLSTDAADWACWSRTLRPSTWNEDDVDVVDYCLKGYLNKTRNLEKGIVLFHDITRQSAELIPRYVEQVLKEDYRLVRLDQISSFRALATEVVGGQRTGNDTPFPIVSERSSPCKDNNKGACVNRSTCDRITAGDQSFKGRFENFDLIANNSNTVFLPTFCPSDPSDILCCFDPNQLGIALTSQNPEEYKLNFFKQDVLVTTNSGLGLVAEEPALISQRTVNSSISCGIKEQDLRRAFFLYTSRKTKLEKCQMGNIREVLNDKNTSMNKRISQAQDLAEECFNQTHSLVLTAHSDIATYFRVYGAKNDIAEGVFTVKFDSDGNMQTDVGSLAMFSGNLFDLHIEKLDQPHDDEQHHEDEGEYVNSHHVNIPLHSIDSQMQNSCMMTWAGNFIFDEPIDGVEKEKIEYLMLPASFL